MKPNRRIALTVEYDGTNYQGFQLQNNKPTIQGELEEALKRLTQQSIRVRGASRTDSGAPVSYTHLPLPTILRV